MIAGVLTFLPVPQISVVGLGGTSQQVLRPVDDQGFRYAVKSPLEVVADTVGGVNWLIPMDQLFLVLNFIAGVYILFHAWRGVRYILGLIRGSGN